MIITRPKCKENPNHNLWQNKNIWWVNYTLSKDPTQKPVRVRVSTKTSNVEEARAIRDRIFSLHPQCTKIPNRS